ncbi:MAG: SUMF1/EgtB/PvdO family nonheme iron enzyme [Nitrospirae bacterium]|nr:SUMF1/EgtB/PvdO family nonheme iron enzyme [Nitrospirota bacterium]MBF0541205.1 SUMF1/EgtB/PvdO family nonheme iron enzyme [Nitrospirota bacterium]
MMKKILIISLIVSIFCITPSVFAKSKKAVSNKKDTTQTSENRSVELNSMQSEKRVALVIGNAEYHNIKTLRNPVNDAKAMARELEGLNFKVISGFNLTQKAMRKIVNQFGDEIKDGGVGLFYFAGHGIQVNGENFLIPVDAEIHSEGDVDSDGLRANIVLNKMADARNRLNIVILDACRDNPFKGFRSSGGGGLAMMNAPKGTFIAYATGPGSVASDGDGKNGLFTQELLKSMEKPGLKIEDVFKDVSGAVQDKNANQVPWIASNMRGDFYFKLDSNVIVSNQLQSAIPTKTQDVNIEKETWATIKNSIDPADYKEFLSEFPNSSLAPLARAKIKQLEKFKQSTQQTEVAMASRPPVLSAKEPIFTESITGIEMVLVKGGCYQMGDTFTNTQIEEKPVHEVCLDDFYIGRYEVTQGQWKKITGKNPSFYGNCGDNCPVENVSWNDVQDFIRELNKLTNSKYRLPSEAQWEYACRSGGKSEKYSGGNLIDNFAWYNANSTGKIHPVGTKSPNGLNIFDMSGNVWEWVQDWYDPMAYSQHTRNNPVYDLVGSGRVVRGGGWSYSSDTTRCAYRFSYSPDVRYGVGFRLIRD